MTLRSAATESLAGVRRGSPVDELYYQVSSPTVLASFFKMSTATLPPTTAKVPEPGPADHLIQERIDEACKALWWAELIRDTLRTLIVALAAILAWVIVDQWLFSPGVGVRVLACACWRCGAGGDWFRASFRC